MNLPEGLLYTEEHEWVRAEDGVYAVGITHFAQEALGDIVYVELPEEGESFGKGDEFGVVESVKAVSDIYMPLAGEIVEVNLELEDTPELINEAPYDAWIVKIKVEDASQVENLFDTESYKVFLEEDA